MGDSKPDDRFIVFGAPLIGDEEIAEIVDSLRSGWLGTGPKVARFEQDFHRYKGGWGHPIAVNSCTAALHLAMISAGLKPGDEVITSSLTFCATVNAIIHAGCEPVVADVDFDSMNISPDSIRQCITPRTRAIIPVHFAGRPCAMDEICSIAQEYDLQIIEDCAHAIETTYHGQPAGTFGQFGCFSFYVTKNVVTGEGGLVLARNEADADRVKSLALHGMSADAWKRFSDDGYKHYDVVESGFKYNMMDIQAALGIHQLKRVDKNWERRLDIWNRYQDAFRDLPIRTPTDPDQNTKHGLHLYTVLIDKASSGIGRDDFLVEMSRRGIGVGVHYRSVCEYPYYQRRFGWKPEECPVATEIGEKTTSLPLSAALSDDDVGRVIKAVSGLVSAN